VGDQVVEFEISSHHSGLPNISGDITALVSDEAKLEGRIAFCQQTEVSFNLRSVNIVVQSHLNQLIDKPERINLLEPCVVIAKH
jgi:hypothetical protein